MNGENQHNEQRFELVVPDESNQERVDSFLTHAIEEDLSRSYIQKLIKSGLIAVNGTAVSKNYRVRTDDVIAVTIPPAEQLALEPQNIPLKVLYEDASVAVINKPAGMVVHPGHGSRDGTLVNALLHHLNDLSSIGGIERPGIVHRLDRDTAGVMVIAKDDRSHRFLADEFAARKVYKKYAAVTTGKPQSEHETIDAPIGRHPKYRHKMTVRDDGRNAVTELFLKKTWNARQGVFSLFDIVLHTGRTHQIRVHLSSTGLPIVGDPVYSKKWEKFRLQHLLLASCVIEFTHPESGRRLRFEVPLPEHMTEFIKKLDAEASGR